MCVQIEDREGLANVAEIAAVPGVDVVFIGPMDLSQAFGHPGDLARPAFRRDVERAFAAAQEAGALTGTSGSAAWVRYGIGLGAPTSTRDSPACCFPGRASSSPDAAAELISASTDPDTFLAPERDRPC